MEFSTEGVKPHERLSRYCEGLRRAYFELDIEPLTAAPLEARIRTHAVSTLLVGRIAGSSQRVARREPLRDDHLDGYFLNVQMRGTGAIEQRDRRIELQPGQAAFVHASSAFLFHFPTTFEQLSLYIPNDLVPASKRSPSALAATTLAATGVVPRMLMAMVRAIAEADDIAPPDMLMVEEQLRSLIWASFARPDEPARGRDTRLLSWIDQQLSDPALNLDMAASALGMSRRSIQYAMQRNGDSFSGRVRRRRVERARALFLEPAMRDVPILDIALRVGFSDASTFCRAFRRVTGQTASAYRATVNRRCR